MGNPETEEAAHGFQSGNTRLGYNGVKPVSGIISLKNLTDFGMDGERHTSRGIEIITENSAFRYGS